MRLPWQRDEGEIAGLHEVIQQQGDNLDLLQERLAELEREDVGWEQLSSGMYDREFSRGGLRKITEKARLYWLKNPLIQRGVNVQAYYVFGQGVAIRGVDEAVDVVIQRFLDDAKNQAELTSHQAMMLKETELTLFGNLFFVFFHDQSSGRVRVRTIPMDEIEDIICNPEDAKDPWYYKRIWQQQDVAGETATKEALYPDWRYRPADKPDSVKVSGKDLVIEWASPVYHVKVGCLSDMRFGVSEVYAALAWAEAYKNFLENWSTIVQAYARFAFKITAKKKAGVAAAKAKLATTRGSGGGETNPPPVTASTFIGQEGVDVTPVRTAGATTSAEDGRRLLLMVAASTGLPESFFGDVSVGTLATAKSLDRPTELKMRARQTLWVGVFKAICTYTIEWAVKAPSGALGGILEDDGDGTPVIHLEVIPNPDTGEMVERDATVMVTFPDILEHSVTEAVDAIVKAGTLGAAGMPAGTIDMRTLSRMLLTALGEQDVDAMLDMMYPEDDEEPAEEAAMMVSAVRELKDAIEGFVRRSDGPTD